MRARALNSECPYTNTARTAIDRSATREATITLIRALITLSVISFALNDWNAQAQGIPPEGPLSITFTVTQIPPPKLMSIGSGKMFAVNSQVMAAVNDDGNPILHNMGGECQFSRLIDTSAKTLELHCYCTYVDKDGDQIFEQCDFVPGAPNQCKLTGGTGKFAGLEATVAITSGPVKSISDGIGQSVGRKKGTYRIVKTQ